MKRSLLACLLLGSLLLAATTATASAAEPAIFRLYDAAAVLIDNPDGREFDIQLEVRDINHIARGPAELLVKAYRPDGSVAVREVVPDDGITAHTWGPPVAGWDHEAWYYATSYSRGLEPAVPFSVFSDPARLAAMPKRQLTWHVAGGQKGVYRLVLAGSPDHYLRLSITPELPWAIAGSPDYLHGHHDLYARKFAYVPKGTTGLRLMVLENDQPANRLFTVRDAKGNVLLQADAAKGHAQPVLNLETPGSLDEQILTVEVSAGKGDYLFNVEFLQPKLPRNWRGQPAAPAFLGDSAELVAKLQNGALYFEGETYWQPYAIGLQQYLKTLKEEDFVIPADLAKSDKHFFSTGSHQSPKANSADRMMHDYPAHKNRQVLNASIREMLDGLRLISPMDHVMHGRNMAYEMGCYSFFYHRPAWRIMQQSDADPKVKDLLRQFIIQIGDRLAFARGIELVNGNSLASLVEGLRYCVAASDDPLQKELFDTYWERFTTGGFGTRIGVGASGGVQESFGYDHHYGGYIIRGWHAIIADMDEPRFKKVHDGVSRLYSYTYNQELNLAPWCSRTHQSPPGGAYDPAGPFPWQGMGGPDITLSINDANEFFVARRPGYYMLTYHGRTTPTWMGEGFHGQIGYSGGVIAQLHVIGKGPVLISRVHGSYGGGMHVSQWRNFQLHTLVGTTADGQPFVAANSEHPDAHVEGSTVTGSGEVRQSSIKASRSYTYNDGAIDCNVKLSPSQADRVFAIYGGANHLRGNLTELYEMLPLLDFKPGRERGKRPDDRLPVLALDAADNVLGPVSTVAQTAKALVLDRGGFGVRVELDQPRPVLLASGGSVLIQLVEGVTPPEAVSFNYRLVPFVGKAPVGGVAANAIEYHRLDVLPVLDKPELVAQAMTDQNVPVQTIKSGANVLANVQWALSGKNLAVSVQVNDKHMARNAVAWKASCVELFGALPNAKELGHIFLTPQVGEQKAEAFDIVGGKEVPAPQIAVVSQAEKIGYRMSALIPLSALRLSPDGDVLLLECQVSAALQPNKRLYATLFGSGRAYESSYQYGRFSTNPPQPAAAAPATMPATAPAAAPAK